MRIMLFIGSMATGGAERQFAVLAGALRDQGHELWVVTMEDRQDDPAYRGLLGDIDQRVILGEPRKGPRRMLQLIRAWRPLRRLIDEVHPDVIYSGLEWPNWLATRAVRGSTSGPPVVVGIRNSAERMSWKRRLPVSWLVRRGEVDGLIANSRSGLDDCHRRGLRSSVESVVPNGIDTTAFRPRPEAATVLRQDRGWSSAPVLIGHVGRLSPMKDHDNLLQAFATFSFGHPDARLVCVGDGPESFRGELLNRARALNVNDRIHWVNRETDLPVFYSALDLLVMSSRDGEGFPNVVAEAMACGTPCVVTDVGDAAEVVGEVGEIVPPSDPEGLAAAMGRQLASALPAEVIRSRIVDRFGVETMATATLSVLRQAVERGSGGSGGPPGMLTTP